jgi:hypothetical protein
MEVQDTFAHVLPKTTPLHLEAWYLDEGNAQITLLIASTQAEPRCPGCDVPARHVHSHYTRTLADLPWSGYGMTCQLRVRKLFCRNRTCPRRIFTERLPGLTAPWARRTLRLTARLLAMGLALGGGGGSAAEPVVRSHRQSEHPVAGDPSRSLPHTSRSTGPQRGRFRPAEAPYLWHPLTGP